MFNLKPFQLSLINSSSLILLGGYGYFQSSAPSMTALIPVVFGFLLLAMNSGIKKQNKVIAHIAVTVTLLMIIGLIMPLLGSIGRSDNAAIFRIMMMMITSIFSMISFIKSFIAAKKS
tara:strand:- start:61 stop:414 length:354 start_codon:yes stop_codon:yes gene_type:complete